MRINNVTSKWSIGYALAVMIILAGRNITAPTTALAEPTGKPDAKAEFLKLCDMACEDLNKEITIFIDGKHRTTVVPKTHHMPFFEDSYGVRALCVAYDMTGKEEYLRTCKHWADRVVALQNKMIPKGAYFLNYDYGRKPGATVGDWWVADSGSVAMSILATAVRTTDKANKQRYVNSVRSFAKLVIDNYVSKEGGITDGMWDHYSGPWWSSSAMFSAAMYLLYDETGDPQYLKVATGATDWMLRHDFRKVDPPAWDAMSGSPAVVFYCGESYAIALKHFAPTDPRHKKLAGQVALMIQWMQENQQGRGAKNQLNYLKQATYMAGIPYLMYAFAKELPEHRGLEQAADQELGYVHGLLWKNGQPQLPLVETWEVTTWIMMSYAEKLCPGALYRSSKP